jgi:hypothetical protein
MWSILDSAGECSLTADKNDGEIRNKFANPAMRDTDQKGSGNRVACLIHSGKRRDWMKWKVLRHDYQIVDSEIYHVIYLIRL